MDEKKKSIKKDVTDTMACSAFAEAGEPCPIDPEVKGTNPVDEKKKSKDTLKDVENTMACSAFAEAGEPCPIDPASEQDTGKGLGKADVEGTMACTAFAEAGEPCPIDTDKKEKK